MGCDKMSARRHSAMGLISLWSLCVSLSLAGAIAAPAHSRGWIKAETDHFVMYSNVQPDIISGHMAAMEAFKEASAILFSEIGDSEIPDDQKQIYYYAKNYNDLKTVRETKIEHSFAPLLSCYTYGYQRYSVDDNYSINGEGSREVPVNLRYLYWSMTDANIHKYFSKKIPHWVIMGLKEYFMTLKANDNNIYIGIPSDDFYLEYNRVEKRTLPVSASKFSPYEWIISDSDKTSSSETRRLQTWIIINYFMTDSTRKVKFTNYLARYQNGEDSLSAFVSATGMQPKEFAGVYRDYVAKGPPYLTYPIAVAPAKPASITALTDYGVDVPLIYSALSLSPCMDKEKGAKLLTQMRDLAIKFPQDDLVALSAAKGEIFYGDPNKAIGLLEPLVARSPDHADALHTLGKAFLSAAKDAAMKNRSDLMIKARQTTGRAYKLSPSSPAILFDFARSHKDLPGYPSDNVLAAAEMASAYAVNMPFHADYDYLVAELYVRKGRYAEALALLEPIENNWPPDSKVLPLLRKVLSGIRSDAPVEVILSDMDAYEMASSDQ